MDDDKTAAAQSQSLCRTGCPSPNGLAGMCASVRDPDRIPGASRTGGKLVSASWHCCRGAVPPHHRYACFPTNLRPLDACWVFSFPAPAALTL